MKKRLFSALLFLCISIFALGTVSASAEEYGDLTYEVEGDVVTITDYDGEPTEIVIPSKIDGYPVTTIGEEAFCGCTSLASVTIPGSVTTIGDSAFEGCTSLASVTLSDGLESIEHYAFYGCTSLEYIEIPASVTEIVGSMGAACENLYIDVDDANDVYCDVDGVVYTKDKKTLVAYAMDAAQPTYVIPDGTTTIGACAFVNCRYLENVTFPDSITKIEADAFGDCIRLQNVKIPEKVTRLEDGVFYGCWSFTSIEISEDVSYIAGNALAACGSLMIEVDEGNPYYCAVDGVLFNKDKTELVTYAKEELQSAYVIPNSVTTIGWSAFCGCWGLESVTIPTSVTAIGEDAFDSCRGLTSVTIPDSVTEIGEDAFDSCTGLESVTIGNGVKTIGNWAFAYCINLKNVTIGNGVTTIGPCAFFYCISLESVTIPGNVTEVGLLAFFDCRSLESVTIENGVTAIGKSAFSYCESLTNVTIPTSVTAIGGGAFSNCESLTTVYYDGTAADWAKISIDEDGNDALLNATIIFKGGDGSSTPGGDEGNIPGGDEGNTPDGDEGNIPGGDPDLMPGDIDGDGAVTMDDAIHLFNATMFPEAYPIPAGQRTDYDGNGVFNMDDAIYLFNYTMFPEAYPIDSAEQPADPEPEQPAVDDTTAAYIAEVIRLVNVERAKQGLGAVSGGNEKLDAAAAVRAGEIVELFSHDRPSGERCFTALAENGVSYYTAGENIAAGQRTPADVVEAWMNSEGHRANILNGSFTQLGVGFVSTDTGYRTYWVQLFIG